MKYVTDSRNVKKGSIFVAIKGHTVDGHDYIDEAVKNGAEKVVAEREVNCSVPLEVVPNTEEYLKEALKKDYSDNFKDMHIIGVTGTNGKTTTCFLVYQLLNLLGKNACYIGTIGFKTKLREFELNNTTPDILTIYNLLNQAREDGADYVVMEVSSHALSYERIYGLNLDIAAFTNLTEDHLDYHKTMENYLHEKLKIVDYLKKEGTLIVNGNDPYGNCFIEKNKGGLTLGINGDFSYNVTSFNITPSKTNIEFAFNGENYSVTTNLTSKFNIYNYITALAIVHACGIELSDIILKTCDVYAPKGRCETIEVNNGYAVIDYAHTPDAVEKVITAYNELKKGRVITIVGCGGDRDPIKRPIMGGIATTLSDYTILTSDNPRTEDPKKIMEDILKGVKGNNYEVILDRKEAIKKGIDMLNPEDILLILGKGHEDYQIIGHTKIHLDDKEQVMEWIKAKKRG